MHQQPALGGSAVDKDIVDDAAGVIAVQRVVRLPGRKAGDVVRGDRADLCARLRTAHPHPAHMRHIEHAGACPDGLMLGKDAGLVLDRHCPAHEWHQSPAGREMAAVQRRPPEIAGSRRTLRATHREPARGRRAM